MTPSTKRLGYRQASQRFVAATGGWTLHDLRHSALTHLAEDGMDTTNPASKRSADSRTTSSTAGDARAWCPARRASSSASTHGREAEMEHDRDGSETEAGGLSPDEQAYFDGLMNPEADEGVAHPLGGMRMGSTAPRTWATGAPTEHVDLGPGGSLRQRYRAARPRRRWAAPLFAVLLLGTAAGVCLTVLALWHGNLTGAALAAAGLALAGAGALAVAHRGQHPAAWLADRARRERTVARTLRPLEPGGWVLLHDRLLPGTHHRIAHLAVGPTGVAVITPIPQDGPVTVEQTVDGQPLLRIGGVRYDAWHEARKWELDHVHSAVAEALDDVVWTGPTFAVYVWLDTSWRATSGWTARYARPAVSGIDGFAIHPPQELPHALSDLPGTLGPDQVDHIAGTVQAAFTPAGRAHPPRQHG